MEHNFDKSSAFEKSRFEKANSFYIQKLGVKEIHRIGFDTEQDKQLQREDIDLILLNKNDEKIAVSEKFRKNNYNDIYFELYSKFPDVIGWSQFSTADYTACFFKDYVVIYKTEETKKVLQLILNEHNLDSHFAEMINNHLKESSSITIKEDKFKIRLIQAYNKMQGKEWYTMGVAIPFEVFEQLKVKLWKYDF